MTSPLVYDHLTQAQTVLQSVFTNNPQTPHLNAIVRHHCSQAPDGVFQASDILESVLTKAHPICEEFKHQFYDKHADQIKNLEVLPPVLPRVCPHR